MEAPSRPIQRAPRRSRPSLAAFADSGYEPSRPPSLSKNNTLPHSFSQGPPSTRKRTDLVDLGVTSQLLSDGSHFKDTKTSHRKRSQTMKTTQSFPFLLDGEQDNIETGIHKSSSGSSHYQRAHTLSRSATISSAWSGVSNRLFTESLQGAANGRQANIFTEQFDRLAKKHGIQPFPNYYRDEPESVSVSSASNEQSTGDSTPVLPGNKFWNKLMRRTPTNVDISKQHGNIKMSLTKKRTMDVSDLAAVGKGKRDSLKGMHLEDMIRLGGVAIFTLPLGLAPGDLLVPTCVHAAATFILNHGLKTPGIFRVSGNINTTFALYDHYQRQLEENNNESVVATTALARLPSHIHYNIHDVAHLFKKLLHGLPGGLLGSPAVFQALYSIRSFVYPDPSLGDRMTRKVKPRMIALAIASINLHFRIALVCSVFGLLRAISLATEQETESKVKDPHETFVQMKEDALGIVFGPLLLGDKSEHILTEEGEDRGGLLVLPKVVPNTHLSPKRGKQRNKLDVGYSKVQLERTKRAALVCQMLIDHWEDISYHLKKINALGVTAQAYDLPAQTQDGFNYVEEEPAIETVRGPRQEHAGSQRMKQGTVRSTRSPEEVAAEEKSQKGRGLHSHGHRLHLPHLHGHIHKPHMEDLIKFSTHNSQEEKQEDLFPTPLLAEKVDLKPDFTQMTPVPEVRSPEEREPMSSPNWRVISPDEMDEPETPTKRYDSGVRFERQDQISLFSHSRSQSSGSSSGASSPASEITPQPARRIYQAPFVDDVVVETRTSLSAPDELDSPSIMGRRAISPVPELSFNPIEPMSDPEDMFRPQTPKPLNLRKSVRSPPQFSIFEDEPENITRTLPAPVSPVLTLTKPNSQTDIKINPKGHRASPTRLPPDSPTRPASVPLQPATPNRRPRASMDSDFEDRYLFKEGETPSPGKKVLRGNSALYAEIRRLQRLVDLKTEEASSTKKELELAKSMANAGTLSHLLRETQEEMNVWKNRAEWAEKQLRSKAKERKGVSSPPARGHVQRYSMG